MAVLLVSLFFSHQCLWQKAGRDMLLFQSPSKMHVSPQSLRLARFYGKYTLHYTLIPQNVKYTFHVFSIFPWLLLSFYPAFLFGSFTIPFLSEIRFPRLTDYMAVWPPDGLAAYM